MKRINLSKRSHHDCLHIEAPGCIVNIRHKLTDDEGRPVISIQINRDMYVGEEWDFPEYPDADSMTIRVRARKRQS